MESILRRISTKKGKLIILLLISLISFFIVAKVTTSDAFNGNIMKSLDEKKMIVLKLTATATATSTTMSLIPGDSAMPIANELAQLSTYFLLILCAIILEKMIMSVVGNVVFAYIIPFACILGAMSILLKKEVLKNLAIKIAIFGVVLFVAIPVSINISDLIYSSYQQQINSTVEKAENNKDFIEDKKAELSEEDKSWGDKVGDFLSDLTSKIEGGVSEMIEKGENTLSEFLDTIAVLLITACVIPIVVILIFAWTIKILFTYNEKSTFSENKNTNIKKVIANDTIDVNNN